VGLEDGGWGMAGIGGSLGWAIPDHGLAWAYVTTRMGDFERALAVEAPLILAAAASGSMTG
jgi:CubicO group peptidase (beta-lactamase class C family)